MQRGSARLKVVVIGVGYLGATHAACMAELGFEVLGVDVDAEKVASLNQGRLPFYEPGLDTLLLQHVEGGEGSTGRLKFTASYEEAGRFGDLFFLCVNTPQLAGEFSADLRHLDAAVEALVPHLDRPCLVVGKSTVPVGTADRVAERIAAAAPAGAAAELAWNPEFLRESFAVQDTLHPDRLVAGVRSERAERLLREVYATPIAEGVPFLATDFATAELVKTAANSFLATKISFINAMAEMCESAGADVVRLSEALSYDERIGGKFLHAGLGFGGGCLPKDIRAFVARAGELGVGQALTFLREVDSINTRRRSRMVEMAREQCGALRGLRVAVLGASFKPDSDDIRDSPALDVAGQLQRQGAQVTVYDPKAMDNARKAYPALDYARSPLEAAEGARLVLHLTEWAQFRELDPAELGAVVAERHILDGRNVLDAAAWRAAGWTYRSMGRS
ncbi:UDP-glucose/GDP-mannose dehydrogenase family protein [Streptomyces sp. NPDC046985]|uniref:UDP-glucose dehydrogenase family protein n=1 Tax=Streptomyces sp. NPDC046985 TaxID=3155377 RepID=UPI0033F74158